MLVRLMPEQVSSYWNLIRDSIDASVAPIAGEKPDRMNRILESLLAGQMVAWASIRKEEETKVIALFTTTVIGDECSGTKNLLMYSLHAAEKSQESDWIEGMETLAKYAKGLGCHRIIAYIKEDSPMYKISERFGADLSYRLVSIAL